MDDMRKLSTLLAICILTSLSSEKYEHNMDGNNEFWRHYCRLIDVLNSKVISIAENVLILNKIQVEENVSAFNTIVLIYL